MRGILGFIKRNVLLFFKDWQSILFSLLTSIIVLVLYLLFLKGTFVSAIQSAMGAVSGTGFYGSPKGYRYVCKSFFTEWHFRLRNDFSSF